MFKKPSLLSIVLCTSIAVWSAVGVLSYSVYGSTQQVKKSIEDWGKPSAEETARFKRLDSEMHQKYAKQVEEVRAKYSFSRMKD